MRSAIASDPAACASRLSVLSAGAKGELIIGGWLSMSNPNAPVTTNAVPLTSNRIACGCLGSRHVSHAPTAYIGMMLKIQTKSERDGPRGDIASANSSYARKSPPTVVSA